MRSLLAALALLGWVIQAEAGSGTLEDAKDRQEFTEHAVWLAPAATWDGSLVVFFTGKNSARAPEAVAYEQRAVDGKFGSSFLVSPLWDRHPDLETGGDALGVILAEAPVSLDVSRLCYASRGRGHEQAQVELALHPGRNAAWKSLEPATPKALPLPWVLPQPGRACSKGPPDLHWVDPRFGEQGWMAATFFSGARKAVRWEGKDGVLDLAWLVKPATASWKEGMLRIEGLEAFTLRYEGEGPGRIKIGKEDIEARWQAMDLTLKNFLRRTFGLKVTHQAFFLLEKGAWVPGS